MRSPSSLIFLVLLGVWAAYFVQYWVRRRDHLATARSVEQFSKAMRVLERRDALPRTDLSEPAPRSYAVHPARANRPQVLVKRAVASDPSGPLTVTARVDDVDHAVSAPRPSGSGLPGSPAQPAASRPAASSRPAAAASAGERRAPVASVRPRMRPARRVRGLFVLAALAELLVIVPLVALGMLPLWALAPALFAVVVTVAYLRSGVRSERAMLRAHRRRLADLARLRSTAPVTASPRRTTAGTAASAPARTGATPARPAAMASGAGDATTASDAGSTATASDLAPGTGSEPVETVAATAAASGTAAAATAGGSPLEVALEVAAATPVESPVDGLPAEVVDPVPAAEVMVPILDEDDMPLTWDPVPVPRPTYTMKAKAERPEVQPAAVTADPVPAVREVESDDEAYDQRRVAGA